MGAVQKLATVVIVGLVGLSTLIVVYLANEGNRQDAEVAEQEEVSVERGIETYLANCLTCHGPAGEGSSAPDSKGTGRIGMALGGQTEYGRERQELNQSENSAEWDPQREVIWEALHYGRGAMPAWGRGGGGLLNDEQIEELITMIHTVDWDLVYNDAVAQYGGYPTPGPPPPRAASAQQQPTAAPAGTPTAGGGSPTPPDGGAPASPAQTVVGVDIAWEPEAFTIPAGAETVVNLPNEGASIHNFAIDELGIDVDMPPGETVTALINAAAGSYEYYCNVPGHKEAGMVGTLTVE